LAVFIVRGKQSDLPGGAKVVRDTPQDAMETANDFLCQGIPVVTIEAAGVVYTTEEFALTIVDPRD